MNTKPRLVFSVLLLAGTLVAYFVPYYDWDLVAYVGSAIALHENSAGKIRLESYAALQRELPEDDYLDIVNGSFFRSDVAKNSAHFHQQLRFYQIRPAYIRLLSWLHLLGIAYVKATRLLSVLALAGTGLLAFLWARRYIDEWQAAISIPFLMIAPVVFTSARTGSPDALSALVILFGTYEAVEHKRILLGSVSLLASLFLRTDNVIFVFLLLGWAAMFKIPMRSRTIACVAAILSVVIVLGVNHLEHGYSWSVLLRNTATPLVNPAETASQFSLADYLSATRDMVDEARESSVMVFPFLAALALFSSRIQKKSKRLVGIVLLSWLAHVILFPHIEDRYFIAGSVIIGIAALVASLPRSQVQRI